MTTCKTCGKRSYNEYCMAHKPRKSLKPLGKHAYRWQEFRKQWILDNPPDSYGYWQCALRISPMCLGRLDKDQLTLDHIETRSSRPDLRYEASNIQPACIFCNSDKGSKRL